MQAYKVEKKQLISKQDAIRYQLLTEIVFLKKESLIDSDMDILILLSMWGPIELSKFCNEAAKVMYEITKMEEFSVKAQNVRNRISKLQKRNLVVKVDKKIQINPSIKIVTEGNILIDYNFLAKG